MHDVLLRRRGSYVIYNVKSSTGDDDRMDRLVYVYFQRDERNRVERGVVVEKSNLTLGNSIIPGRR